MTKSAYARNKPKHSLCGKCDRYRSYCEYIGGVKSSKRTRCPDFKLGLKQNSRTIYWRIWGGKMLVVSLTSVIVLGVVAMTVIITNRG